MSQVRSLYHSPYNSSPPMPTSISTTFGFNYAPPLSSLASSLSNALTYRIDSLQSWNASQSYNTASSNHAFNYSATPLSLIVLESSLLMSHLRNLGMDCHNIFPLFTFSFEDVWFAGWRRILRSAFHTVQETFNAVSFYNDLLLLNFTYLTYLLTYSRCR